MALNLLKRLVLGRKLEKEEVDSNWTAIENAVNGKAPQSHSHAMSNITGLIDALAGKIATAARGVANGVASLGADGKVPLTQLPDLGGAANDMIFPTETLTNSDVGKLVILKDGLAQLPEFVEEVDTPAVVEIVTKPAVTYFAPQYPRIKIAVGSGIDEDDQVTISTIADDETRQSFVFIAKASPSADNHFAIGVDEDATAANLKDLIEAFISLSLSGDGSLMHPFHEVTVTENEVFVNARVLLPEDDANASDYWTTSTVGSDADIVVTKLVTSWSEVVNSAWLGYLAVKGVKISIYDYEVQADATDALVFWFLQTDYHSKEFLFMGDTVTTVYLPINATEMIAGIARTLPLVFEDTSFRSANSTIAAINFPAITEAVVFDLPGGEIATLTAYFEDPELTPGEYSPSFCELPIIGQVTNVVGGNCYISCQPIRRFLLKGPKPVSIDTGTPPHDFAKLLSLLRIAILDENNPGYIKSITSIKYITLVSGLIALQCGFVIAYESAEPDNEITGAFSTDFSLITLL